MVVSQGLPVKTVCAQLYANDRQMQEIDTENIDKVIQYKAVYMLFL